MAPKHRKAVLDLPMRMVLSERGASAFLSKKQRLKRFRAFDGGEEYGLRLDSLSPASMQHLILAGYLSMVEMSLVDWPPYRQDLMDFSKSLVYGLLYRRFDLRLQSLIMDSSSAKQWRLDHPNLPFGNEVTYGDGELEMLQASHAVSLDALRFAIVDPLRASISRNRNILPEELRVQLYLTEKFLKIARAESWLALHWLRETEDFDALVVELRALLLEYMEKTRIAEYVALMTTELTQHAHEIAMGREVQGLYRGVVDGGSILFDRKVRDRVLSELTRKGESLRLLWVLNERIPSGGVGGSLRVVLWENRSGLALKDLVCAGGPGWKPLTDYYQALPPSHSGSELGLYYLNYLSEACAKVAIRLDTAVFEPQNGHFPATSLLFTDL